MAGKHLNWAGRLFDFAHLDESLFGFPLVFVVGSKHKISEELCVNWLERQAITKIHSLRYTAVFKRFLALGLVFKSGHSGSEVFDMVNFFVR